MNKKFIKWTILFLVPVVIVMVILELLVLELPTNYKNNSTYFNTEKQDIKIMAVGSSQMEAAVYPDNFKSKTICLASKSQHHDLDFPVYSQLAPKMNSLKTLIIELSYSHLEIPHNGPNFWKHGVYLKYYDVNAFERKTYFKDKLIYLSNPDIYSRLLVDYYIKRNKEKKYNKYGIDTTKYSGYFKSVNYDTKLIDKAHFSIRTQELPAVFEINAAYFMKMIKHAKTRNLNVVVVTIPLNKTYLKSRNPNILRRRDSMLGIAKAKYPDLKIFNKEEDTINFSNRDFRNYNHLNPTGAKKFSIELSHFIEENFPN